MIVRPYSILLDAEALSLLAVDDRSMQAWATVARRTDSTLYVSAVTLAETTDGSARDVAVRRTIKAVRIVDVNDQVAYRAGGLRASGSGARRMPRDSTVDAVVASTARCLPSPVVVLTSDPGDLTLLLQGTPVRVEKI